MDYIFELVTKQIGFSRTGRIVLSKKSKKYITTPNILIPLKSILINDANFAQEFEDHDVFITFNEKYLQKEHIPEKFRSASLLFTHQGTLERFQEILKNNLNVFNEKALPIIPFNIPTSSINKDFAAKEIRNYLDIATKILKSYPTFTFGLSVRIFDYFELFDLYIPVIKENNNVKLLNLVDFFDNFSNFRNILKCVVQIKKDLDNNLVLLVSGRITTKFYPILIYLGVDLIDSSYLLYLSAENFYQTIEHLLPIYKVKYLPCSCVACKGKLKDFLEEKYSQEKTMFLCLHNLITAKNYMNKIKQYLHYEDFRAFVEKSSLDDTHVISLLKVFDKQYFEAIDDETPITQEVKDIKCLGPSSYYRPDFQKFRERTIRTFQPEPWTSLIVLLPCSAKKPYSESKSHLKFLNVLRKFPEFPDFQEFILTSPLGAIPRQLENIFPVNSYDISVTGEWDNEELNIAAEMLVRLLEKYENKRIPIICHLEGGYIEIIKRAMANLPFDFYFSKIQDSITSKESLQSFQNLIQECKDKYKPEEILTESIYLSKTWTRKFVKILDYQFGAGAGLKIITDKLNLKKNRMNNNIDLIDSETEELIGTFKTSSGSILLTLNGAERLFHFSTSNILVFNGEKIRGNTLFRIGVLECSPNLSPNEQVVILDNEKKNVIGIGQLLVSSNFIKNSKTGRIAKIYDKR